MRRPLLTITLIYIFFVILLRPLIDKPIKPFDDQQLTLAGIVASEPAFNGSRVSFDLAVLTGARGSVRASFPAFDVKYGDKIKSSGIISFKKSPQNPGLPDRAYLSFRSFKKPQILSRGHGHIVMRAAFFIRKRLLSSVEKILPGPYSDLLSGILFGKAAAAVPEEIKEEFKKTGTVHLLVVSGMHLSILIGTILALVRLSRLPLWASVIVASVFNLLYVLAAGAGASVVRAGVMAEAAMLGQVFEREKDFFTTLSAAALFLLVINPLALFEAGFQLSFLATISLVCLAPVIEETIHELPLRNIISISVAPVLMTAPVILYNFGQFSPVAVFANALIISWIGYLVILGFAAALLGNIFLPFAEILGGSLFLMLKLLHGIVSFFAGLPFACVYLPPLPFFFIIIYYIFLFHKKLPFKINKKPVLIIILVLSVWGAALAPASQFLEVTMLDVGQGDAIFIESPSGKKVLVDGGDSFQRAILPYLHRRGINKLDLVVLTHPHDDHVGGLVPVLSDMKVDMVLDSGQTHPSSRYMKFLELVNRKKIKYMLARAGQVINLGSGVKASVLNPSEPLIEESALNNNSVVLQLVYGDVSVLLMGDAEKEAEGRIMQTIRELSVRILKIGHHGSNTASSLPFLEAINPQIALISCGKGNKFRHPHKSTLDKLDSLGIKVYRTDEDGAVIIKTDGRRIFADSML